ncbi:MAG: oligosaccharide flippase family protein [Actinomycetota bacterium]|nr:oligosaccharide flippase family protein [Actinomycetota bacterium]
MASDQLTASAAATPAVTEGTRIAARNAAVVAAAEIAGKVATLAFMVAAARILGRSGFGAFSFALSFSLLAATLPSFGFAALLTQRASAEPARLPQLLSEILVWRTAIAVPVFAGAAVAGLALMPGGGSTTAFLLVLLASFVDIYTDAGRAAAGARQDLRGVSVALVVQRFVTAGLALFALLAGFGLVGLAATYLAGTAVGTLGVAVSLRRLGVTVDMRSIRRDTMLATGRMSIAIGIDTVVAMALFRIDQVMLGALKGQAAVGVYAAAYRLLETVLFLSWSLARAVYPMMSADAERSRVRRGLEQAVAAVALIYVPFGVALWIDAGPILRVLYGASYAAGGTSVVRWLAAAPLVFGVGFLGNFALLARRRRWEVAAASSVAAAYNVGMNFVLIPHLSGTGAAIVTTTSYALEAVVILGLLVRDIGWPRLDRAVALPVAAAALMGAFLVVSPFGPLVELPTGAVLYGGAWFLLARWRAPEHLAVIASVVPGRRRET